MPTSSKKTATTKSEAAKPSSRTKSASSKTAAKAPTKRATAKTPSRKTAAAKGTGQKTARTHVNGAAGRATTSTRATASKSRGRASEQVPVKELASQTMQDYTQAKKALGQLWGDLAKTTYSAFNTIAGNVEKRFEQSRKAISEIDVRYALEKTNDKLKSLKDNASAAAQQLGRQVKLIYQMLKDSTAGKFKAPWATVSAITAALLYFISPIDVLPDFIPGVGLIDDALVISLCISVIKMDLRRYAKENGLDLAQYGLAKDRS